jgi:hypothetical protein
MFRHSKDLRNAESSVSVSALSAGIVTCARATEVMVLAREALAAAEPGDI